MASTTIPKFEHTSMEDIDKITTTARATFASCKTKDLEWRRAQLRKLYWGIKDHTPMLLDALMKDMRKPHHESLLTEIDWIANDCLYTIKKIEEWAKDEPIPDVPFTYWAMSPRVRKEPLGMALIIGAYNFPIQLSLCPFIGAIAAGCTAVLKPSEGSPNCAMALKVLIESSLDRSAFAVVNGAVPETTALLDVKWDKILYTGSAQVGKIIAKKAAEHLTPVTLELGGLNPGFVTKNADLKLAARRLMWAKSLNAGQVCLSQNYVLVERSVLQAFIKELQQSYKSFYPSGAKNSPDFSRIINKRQFDRIKRMLDNTQGEIVVGGEIDEDQLFIDLTAVLVKSPRDSCMVEESFGPVFSILAYDTLDEAIGIANSVFRTPLSLFTFGNDKENEKILREVTSGGATINDSFFHASILTVPFGGVGESGTGAYRGRSSFDTFTHRRSIATVPGWADKLMRVRYPPYSASHLKRAQKMAAGVPDFDRNGRPIRGLGYWFGFVLRLGGGGAKGALMRWVTVLAIAYALTVKRPQLGF